MNETIKSLCDFVDASPTAWHAAEAMAVRLDAAGAVRLDERAAWKLDPGRTYYVERNGSALIAFRPGSGAPAEAGFALANAHTDSPALKARIEKPLADRGYERIPVEVYGSPIISSWLDRPLSLAGRVVVRSASGDSAETRLVNLDRPVGVIPSLAIHLNREVNKGFEYNPQNHLPVLVACGTEAAEAVPGPSGSPAAPGNSAGRGIGRTEVPWAQDLVAEELGVAPDRILAADLFFVDAQKTVVIGNGSDLVNGYRFDDLAGCHAILEAFLAAHPAAHGQVAVFMDNEEIGSRTLQGADSSFIRDTVMRICLSGGCTAEGCCRALASSFCISIDAAQAWHPSYPEKYDDAFTPVLNGGPALKASANFKYATDARSESRFRLLCEAAGVPCQKLMMRADMAPGSTIGTMTSALTGVSTVDVGTPLLSMHSLRETIGARDHEGMIAVVAAHFGRGGR